jgi:hypothetical protein
MRDANDWTRLWCDRSTARVPSAPASASAASRTQNHFGSLAIAAMFSQAARERAISLRTKRLIGHVAF